jgi:hypothetical protein
MSAEDRSSFEERYSSQVSVARELHALSAGGRKRRRTALEPAGPTDSEQAARPELCPSLLGIGDEYAVRPETVRKHVFEACGSSKSYLSCVEAIQAEALPKPSLGSLMAAADDGLDPGKVGKFRVQCMSCKDKHYGLCVTRDGAYYEQALSVAWRVADIVAKICKDQDRVGKLLLRFSATYGAEGQVVQYEHVHVMLARVMNRPRGNVFALMAEKDVLLLVYYITGIYWYT